MAALGFSINTLTLFGLILAIAIVVDDAIVVTENATRILDEGKLDARAATEQAMGEITGPIVGVVLVLLAVFIPTTLISGISGQLYKQFAFDHRGFYGDKRFQFTDIDAGSLCLVVTSHSGS